MFFLFCILTFTFFIFSNICVDFRLPLPPSLGQLGPICDRFGFNFCSVSLEVGERRRRKRQDPRGQTKKNTHTHNPTIQRLWPKRPTRRTNGAHTAHTHRVSPYSPLGPLRSPLDPWSDSSLATKLAVFKLQP